MSVIELKQDADGVYRPAGVVKEKHVKKKKKEVEYEEDYDESYEDNPVDHFLAGVEDALDIIQRIGHLKRLYK